MRKILVIDDNNDLRMLMKSLLSRNGYEVFVASCGLQGLSLLKQNEIDLVLCDFRLNDMDGRSVLIAIKEINPATPVIIITGYSDIRIAIEVMRLGATDYIIKPLITNEILMTVNEILKDGNRAGAIKIKERVNAPYLFNDTHAFREILKQVDLVAPTGMSVIIYGESGSGKEALAQEIHKRSTRKDKPFIAIDCGCLSKELGGSALFGHEKGAFTGAIGQVIGSLEIAKGGTVFLDEISNLDYDVQLSLLRVLQERKIRRVGGVMDIPVDIRIVVASNKKLWDAAGTNKFRKDLYHRFNEFIINVPPLRERKEDILFYADYFLEQANGILHKDVNGFDDEVKTIFMNYPWYGNLRELNNVVKRATLLTNNKSISMAAIPFEIINFKHYQSVTPVVVKQQPHSHVRHPLRRDSYHAAMENRR